MDSLRSLKINIEKELVGSDSPQFAALDFDNTCIFNDIGEAAFAFMCRTHSLKNKQLLPTDNHGREYHKRVFLHYHDLCSRGKYEQAYIFCAQAFAGYAYSEIDALIEGTLAFEGGSLSTTELFGVTIPKGISVRPIMSALMNYLIDHNVDIWIVSASPEVVVGTGMRYLNVPGKVIGIRPYVANGILLQKTQQPYSMFDGKVKCIKKFIDPQKRPILSIGDSPNDLAMITYGKVKAIVDGDSILKNVANLRCWHILE